MTIWLCRLVEWDIWNVVFASANGISSTAVSVKWGCVFKVSVSGHTSTFLPREWGIGMAHCWGNAIVPIRRQAIALTTAELLTIGPLGNKWYFFHKRQWTLTAGGVKLNHILEWHLGNDALSRNGLTGIVNSLPLVGPALTPWKISMMLDFTWLKSKS